jgi:hypothetical protein
MSTSLDTIIANIKDVALNHANFTSVEELTINLNSNSDTELDKLFIRLIDITYNDFNIDTTNEKYRLELIIIMAISSNPALNLKNKMDLLLNKLFTINTLFNTLILNKKVNLVEANLTNDRDLYSKLGGQGVTIRLEIDNINAFNKTPCN